MVTWPPVLTVSMPGWLLIMVTVVALASLTVRPVLVFSNSVKLTSTSIMLRVRRVRIAYSFRVVDMM